MKGKHLIIIAGPTASGKTALAIHLAEKLETEILSADSRQFYREMSIGTAKPAPVELQQVKHHFIDSLTVTQDYNVGMFERDTLNLLEKIYEKKDTAVMAGGSGLYIQAVCKGFDDLPEADPELREQLILIFREEGIASLQNRLQALDPVYFQQVDIKNPHRLIRAIEVCQLTGKRYSDLRKTGAASLRTFSPLKIGLSLSREEMYKRINRRVDLMMEQGLLEEVKKLLPYRSYNALNTLGYKELFEYIDGKTSLPLAVEKIKQNTRNFAKRQMTWFRKDSGMNWFQPDDTEGIWKLIREKTGIQS